MSTDRRWPSRVRERPSERWVSAWPATRASGQMPMRYEDIDQQGGVKLLAFPAAIGAIVWHQSIRQNEAVMKLQRQGIAAILTRLWLQAGQGPVSASRPFSADGRYRLAH